MSRKSASDIALPWSSADRVRALRLHRCRYAERPGYNLGQKQPHFGSVLAFADSAKALVANSFGNLERVKTLWYTAMMITAGMMILWIAAVPAFPSVARALTDDAETVKWATTAFGILFVPYVLFSFNTVTDSFFYGLGQTKYLAYQAFLTNGSVYFAAFLLYISGVWEVTFEGVMVLFSLGILVDSFLTLYFLIKMLYVDPVRRRTAAASLHP